MQVWTIRLGESNFLSPESLELSVIGIRWEITDSELKKIKTMKSRNQIDDFLRGLFDSGHSIGNIRRFINEANIGDYVFCGSAWKSSDPDDDTVGFLLGKITSEARKPNKNEKNTPFTVVRDIEWRFFDEDNDDFPPFVADGIKRAQLTFSRFNKLSFHKTKILFEEGKIDRGIEQEVESNYSLLLDSIIESFKRLDFDEFEKYVRDILEEDGWIDMEVIGKTGDGGIDVIGSTPITSAMYLPAIIQVKRYEKKISKKFIEDLQKVETENKELVRFLITSSDFSKQAYIQSLKEPRVFLINGEDLAKLAFQVDLIPHITWLPEDLDKQEPL